MQARVWALLLALALAAPVGAQEASFTLQQEEAPSSLEVVAGESTSVPFGLNLTGEGFACAADVQAPVNASIEAELPSGAPDNASVEAENATTTFPIPAGTYQTEAYSQNTTSEVTVETGAGVSENYTATLTLQSLFPGGTYEDCLPNEFPSAESQAAQITLDVEADEPEPEEPEPEPPTNETNETDENDTAPPNETGDDGNGIPAGPVVPLGLAAAALLRRREA